ncbi:T9SS type A sorting domain-containing protein [Hymenobacter gummosus]|uniref:T9SS type A sorting domain-containing protein n=1 Tax=Hymenobacter gummosus TaxID=1776032 RepID=A0A431TZD1_9BACT|nr:T9SS type A sorting domain-containing protein [Hymenobacter gummosus]RTQ47588.1 T9SS type A sorting domain-containing protein [Hymenobacter gummosus]
MRVLFFCWLLLGGALAYGQGPGSAFAWQRSYVGPANETGGHAGRPRGGGYVLVGTGAGSSPIHGPLLVVRLTDAGDTLWTRKILPARLLVITPQGIVEDASGDLVVSGSCRAVNPTAGDAFVLKMNAQADTAWVRTFRTPGTDSFGAPVLTTDGNYFVFGWINFQNRVLKVSPAGTLLWNVISDHSTAFPGVNVSLLPILGGGCWVFSSGPDAQQQRGEVGIHLLTSAGVETSRRVLPRFEYSAFRVLQAGNRVLVAGAQEMALLDAQADTVWVRRYPPSQANRGWTARGVVQDALGDYVVLADALGGPRSDTHFQLLRFTGQGQLRSDTLLFRPAGSAYAQTLLLAPGGDYFISGYALNGPLGGSDLVAAQFRRFKPLPVRAAQPLAGALQLYPNPASGPATAHAVLPAGLGRGATLMVLDALGRVVQPPAPVVAPGEAPLPVADLPAGVYVVRLRAADGRTWTGRLLRQ